MPMMKDWFHHQRVRMTQRYHSFSPLEAVHNSQENDETWPHTIPSPCLQQWVLSLVLLQYIVGLECDHELSFQVPQYRCRNNIQVVEIGHMTREQKKMPHV